MYLIYFYACAIVFNDMCKLPELIVITTVYYSEWAAPIIALPKTDGQMRICGDYKVTINPVLEVEHYLLPTPEDLFATVADAKCFSKRFITCIPTGRTGNSIQEVCNSEYIP